MAKYPKRWDANDVSVHSRETENGTVYGVSLSVYRPGTIHHERRIVADLDYGQLVALGKAVEYQLSKGPEAAERGRR